MDKNKDTRTHKTSIGFGMTLGGILTLLIMIPFFGNDKEALCVIPVVFLGSIIMGWDDRKERL
jgi:hypothetical protein